MRTTRVLYTGTRDRVKGVEANQHDTGMQIAYGIKQAKGCVPTASGSRLLRSTQTCHPPA